MNIWTLVTLVWIQDTDNMLKNYGLQQEEKYNIKSLSLKMAPFILGLRCSFQRNNFK